LRIASGAGPQVFEPIPAGASRNDFVATAQPCWVEAIGDFNVRGGIKTEVRATYCGKPPEI